MMQTIHHKWYNERKRRWLVEDKTAELVCKVLDDANKLNRHMTIWFSIVIISLVLTFGICFIYNTHMTYDYDFSSINVNKNINENTNEGE
jgi:hypothetical protein